MRASLTTIKLLNLLVLTAHAKFFIYSRTRTLSCPSEDCEDFVVDDIVACPTNKDNCKCWGNAGATIPGYEGTDLPAGFFEIQPMCGTIGPVAFHSRPGGRWEYWADQRLLGFCEPASGLNNCIIGPFARSSVGKLLICDGIC
jgi:hypothetical protein